MTTEAPWGGIARGIAGGPFDASWSSLSEYTVPAWYMDGKFGIFVHWGPYSVPAYRSNDAVGAPDSTWYPRRMYQQGTPEYEYHRATYGPQDEFGYKDFIPRFGAENFDANEWARIFRLAGARFVVPVAEHHDGFAMYDCAYSPWNATRIGPTRDVISELSTAFRNHGLVLGLSSHRAEHWWFMNGGMAFESDVRDPAFAELYGPAQPEHLAPDEGFLQDWLLRTIELIDKYDPSLLWFDWWIEEPSFEPYLQKLAAYYYNWAAARDRGVVINHRKEAFPSGTAVFGMERGSSRDLRAQYWQADTSVSRNAWSYVPDHEYKSVVEILGDLADTVSKNGSFLLNVGPMPDGRIPEAEQDILQEIGRWLEKNGEAIYGTRPWKIYGEGPTQVRGGKYAEAERDPFTSRDVRFTTRGEILYAIALAWPDDGHLLIRSLARGSGLQVSDIVAVELLGRDSPVAWERTEEGLHIGPLGERADADHAPVFRILPEGVPSLRWH